jgi:hypothetical protein
MRGSSEKGRALKRIAIAAGMMLVVAAAMAIWQRSAWIKEMETQCESATPLVSAGTVRNDLIRKLGNPSVEYGYADWPVIERNFGSQDAESAKTSDIRRWLQERGRLMVYSRSNSIMFLYLDADGKASHVSCFLQ